VIARVQQTISSNEKSLMTINIAKIDVSESLLEIILMSGKCLNRIFSESTPKNIADYANRLTSKMSLDTDIISLKRLLGEYMFEQKEYPF